MSRLRPATGTAVRRALRRHRRLVCAVLAAVAVWTALRALAPPAGATVGVPVAARDLPAGVRLAEADVDTADLPAAVVPDGVTAPRAGDVLTNAMRRGEPFTDVRLETPSSRRRPAGSVVLAVRTADAAGVLPVRAGDLVDVLAGPAGGDAGASVGSGGALSTTVSETLARDVLVLSVPGRDGGPAAGTSRAGGTGADDSADGSGDGLLTGLSGGEAAGGTPPDTSGVVVLAADRAAATRIAAAAGVRPLTVTVVSP